jgi:hypothetical protein
VREVMDVVLLKIRVEVQVAGSGCSSGCRCDREAVAVVQQEVREMRAHGQLTCVEMRAHGQLKCGERVQGFSLPAILRWVDSGRGFWG